MEEKNIDEIIIEIQENYRNKLKRDDEIFHHLLKQIKEHIIKLEKLKKHDEKKIFKREIADMYLLSLGLIKLEKVSNKTIKESANYYLQKIKEIYNKDGN